MTRGLLWLAGGLVLLMVLLVASAPELLSADAAALTSLAGLVLAAAIPGLVIIAVVAVRAHRARTGSDDAVSKEDDR